jgi:plastocyanin
MSEFQPQRDRRRMRSWHSAGAGLSLAAALLVVACGGNSGGGGTTGANRPSSPSSLNLAPKGNQLLFNTNKLTAKAGKVTIDFTNNSALQHTSRS